MSKSKNRPEHKEQVAKFKQTKKQTTMEQEVTNQITQEQPSIRNTPVWKSTDTIEMNGLEFQEIFKFLTSVNQAYTAVHSVLNKNILNGTVKMLFEKLNPETNEYQQLEGDDAKPYQEEFDKMVETVKIQQATPQPTVEEDRPERLDALVDQHGVPINENDRSKSSLSIV